MKEQLMQLVANNAGTIEHVIEEAGRQVIILGRDDHPVADWVTAGFWLQMMPNCVALEMEPITNAIEGSTLILDDMSAGRNLTDCATVLAVGPDIRDVQPGDRVGVLPWRGKYFKEFVTGDYASRFRVIFVGIDSMDEYDLRKEPWDTHVCVKILEAPIVAPEHASEAVRRNQLQPLGDFVLIRREKSQETRGNLYLPDNLVYRNQYAEVIAIGPKAFRDPQGNWVGPPVSLGDRVVYRALSILVDFQGGERYGFVGDPTDYALARADQLYAVEPI